MVVCPALHSVVGVGSAFGSLSLERDAPLPKPMGFARLHRGGGQMLEDSAHPILFS